MGSPEERVDISQIIGCNDLRGDILSIIGDKTYNYMDILAIGFILCLRNNYSYNLDSKGDSLLYNTCNTVYNMKYVSLLDRQLLETKLDCSKQVLIALNIHGSADKYIGYVAWNMKYASLVLNAIDIYRTDVLTDMEVRKNCLSRLKVMILEEFGYFSTQILLHVLAQLIGDKHLFLDRAGSVITEDISICNICVASKGSLVTKDLSILVEAFNLPYAKIEDIREEVMYIYKQPVLTPIQMKLLCHLSYRDRLLVLHQRIKYLCDHLDLSQEIAIVKKLGTYEWQHAFNVAIISGLLAIELQVSVKDFNSILIGALLHDIGKSRVPKEILEAPRRLTADELTEVRKHPTYGAELLKGFSKTIVNIAAYHHACSDGMGYPPTTDIPKAAAIVHIADIFDAMCRERDYKKPYDRNYVKKYILEHETWFDEKVLAAFKSAAKIFVPGEIAFVSGNPCTFYDANNNEYTFYVEELKQFIRFSEEELDERLLWCGSIKA